jgi:hypothetical protein
MSSSGDRGFGQGVAVGDLNEDGFADLLVLNYGPNVLLINNGDGTFSDRSDKLGENGETWSASAAIADLDGDTISDLVIVNYCAGLEPVTVTCPMKEGGMFRSCTPMKFAAAADNFLQGTAEGRLVDRTHAWGAVPSVLGRGLGVVAGALEASAGVDVFVANDMTINHYWSVSSDAGSFGLVESAMLRGLGGDDRSQAQGSMGIATADFDRDGDIDLYVTNFEKEYNTYHEQREPGIWRDQTARLGLSEPTLPLVGFGTQAVDLDLDGSLELIVANGHVDMFSRGDERSLYEHPMQIFRRGAAGAYESVGQAMPGPYLTGPHVGRALWTIDANRDGLTDLAVTHQTEPTALLINRSAPAGNWLAIQLVGRSCSRDAIGAIVEVSAGEQRWIAAQTSGDGYMCSNERALRFGLGPGIESYTVNVRWPDGTSQQLADLGSGRGWLVVQGEPEAYPL